jgi:hypothetical protein
MAATPARAYATPAATTSQSLLSAPSVDTSLPATFAWLAEPATSVRVTRSNIEVADARPLPDIAPVLREFQDILDRLEPQVDEGDLSGLAEEIGEWAPYRARAMRPLIDED